MNSDQKVAALLAEAEEYGRRLVAEGRDYSLRGTQLEAQGQVMFDAIVAAKRSAERDRDRLRREVDRLTSIVRDVAEVAIDDPVPYSSAKLIPRGIWDAAVAATHWKLPQQELTSEPASELSGSKVEQEGEN